MPRATGRDVEIEYQTFGEPAGRPLLLVMGLGMQMIGWEESFCEALVERGHFVVRFDNRDTGLSTRFDAGGVPDPLAIAAKAAAGEAVEIPYTLDHMAEDAAAVLDALDLDSAHVCGASMGGMIAQTLAIRFPERVRSLVSIMSTTGNPALPPPRPEAMSALLEAPPADRAGAIEHSVRVFRAIGGPAAAGEEARIRARAALAYDRAFHPDGAARQLAAILAHGSRVEGLRRLQVPTLVIHGDADPLVPIEGGRDTAAAVPDADMLVIEGMGHDLPPAVWPRIVDAISELSARAEGADQRASAAT